MKTLSINLILVIFLVVGSVYPLMAQTPEQLYQKGLMKEEGEGNLVEAINIYNLIVENQNADQSLQAKALLHVGMCYEKLGKEEALKAYQQLVNNFPGEKQEVAIARTRLNRLIMDNQKTVKKKEEEILKRTLTNKKIWDESDTDLEGAVSPDGKYLSYVDWDTGDLALYEIATGKKRRLTNKGSWEKSPSYCEYSRWFPDGKRIIYLWYNEEEGIAELRTINIDNQEPETLIKDKEMEWAEIYECSRDGKYVLACLDRKNDKGILTLISLNDGSERALRSGYTSGASFSHDQRYVIYDLPQKDDKGNKDIYIMELDTKNETKLIEHPGDDRLVGRVPNGNDILFISDRTGTPDFWRVKVQNGKSLGEAELVKSNKGPFPPINLGFTNNGSFYYGQRRNNINIYETEIDPLTGEIITTPTRIIQSYIGANGCPDYSPDGKYLAYVSRRPPGTMSFTTNPVGNVLRIRSLETKEEREFRPNINVFGWPRWSPDGNSVMVVSFNVDGNFGYYQIDTRTGIPKPLLITNSRDLFGGHGWLSDGNTFFYGLRDSITREYQVILQNINSGKKQVLYQSSSYFGISASRDGAFLGLFAGHAKSLKIVPVKGGESKELLKSEEVKKFEFEPRGLSLTWSSDGKYIYFAMRNNDVNNSELEMCRISVANQKIDKLGIKTNSHFANLNAHPDGKHFSYSSRDKLNSEVWKLDNFLPSENEETASKEPEGIRIRQIGKKPFLDDFGTVSRDGRYLSFVDWEDGELAILDLNTGEKRILTKNATLDENPEKFVIGSAISKNGKKVAYSWWRPNHTFDLHIFDIEKNSSKLLYKEDKVEAYPVAWRADNEIIVIRRDRNKELSQVTLFNILDGTFQELKTGWPGLCVSPDGNFLAYSTKKGGQSNSDIYLLTIDEKVEVPLIVHPANDKVIGWIPNRDEFLFISDRSGTWDLWSIQIINDKPSGEPRRLFSEIGEVEPVGITEKGECFIGFRKRNFNAYILPVNKLTGKPEGKPEIPLAGSIYSKNWSPDGKYMARVQEGKRSWELIIRDVENGNERRVVEELISVRRPYWSNDGQSVYIFGMDKKRLQNKGYKGGIYKVDKNSNNLEQKLLISDYEYTPSVDDALEISGIVVSDDQQFIYMLFQNDWIVKHDLNTGKDTILYRHPKFVRGVFQLSPDGNKLLFAIQNKGEKLSRLLTISTQGGDEKELCMSQESNISGSAFWSPDGKYVYFSERPEGTNLWRVDANGGTPEKTWKTDKGAESFIMHPSGEKISYSVRERITEVRVIEGLVNELNKIYNLNE